MIALVVTIALAFVGYIATYINGLRLTQRQERLARVNRQLSDFYGPLFALTEGNSRSYAEFLERNVRPDGSSPFGADGPAATERESSEWRLWASTVFLPNIQAMRDLVIQRADLLREREVPAVLLELCAHVSGYEITAARWAREDYSEHLSVVPFPDEEIRAYARRGFTELKAEQARLLGG